MTTDVVIAHGTAVVTDDGRDRWTYHVADRRRPFIHPLRAPSGAVLTVDAPDDHPWHHGLWFTIKYVNGENYWEELEPYGVLRHVGEPPLQVAEEPDGISIAGTLHWIHPDRETVVLREARSFTHHALGDDAYAIDFSSELTPSADTLLDRTPFDVWGGYGGLAFRGRPDFRDTRLLLNDGGVHDRLEGVPAAALDISGTVDDAAAGVALLDAPDNVRHPVPWYGSTRHATYGSADGADEWSNFVNAAFLFHAPLEVAGDDRLTIRHRIVVHDGVWNTDDLTAAVDTYHRHLQTS